MLCSKIFLFQTGLHRIQKFLSLKQTNKLYIYKKYMSNFKNITNGQLSLNYDPEDKVSHDIKLIKSTNYDSLDSLKRQDPNVPISYYIQNIRSGSFSQISQTYMKESAKEKSQDETFTTDSFQTQMHLLFVEFQNKLFKITTFFQGLFAGMALLYTITLNLSVSVSPDLIRFQDQCMRVLSLLSTLGALYSVLISKQKYDLGKVTATSAEVDQLYKSSVLCFIELIFYMISYVIYVVSHKWAVFYNVQGTGYNDLKSLTTAFTIVTLIGWIITNTNTYKYENKN